MRADNDVANPLEARPSRPRDVRTSICRMEGSDRHQRLDQDSLHSGKHQGTCLFTRA